MKDLFKKYRLLVSIFLLCALFVSTNGLTDIHVNKSKSSAQKEHGDSKQENLKPGTDLQQFVQSNGFIVDFLIVPVSISDFAPSKKDFGTLSFNHALIFFRKILFEHIISAQAP